MHNLELMLADCDLLSSRIGLTLFAEDVTCNVILSTKG